MTGRSDQMVLTVYLPKELHQKMEKVKQKTGLSKSDIARQAILKYFSKAA